MKYELMVLWKEVNPGEWIRLAESHVEEDDFGLHADFTNVIVEQGASYRVQLKKGESKKK